MDVIETQLVPNARNLSATFGRTQIIFATFWLYTNNENDTLLRFGKMLTHR